MRCRVLSRLSLAMWVALSGACEDLDAPSFDDADTGFAPELDEALAQRASSTVLATFMTKARADLGKNVGLQCKPWVQAKATQAGLTIPTTATNQFSWNAGTPVQLAQWRATYANGRADLRTVAAGATSTFTVSVPNGDPQVVVLYGPTSLTARVTSATGTQLSSVVADPNGKVGAAFTPGRSTITVKVTNTSGASQVFTAVVLSRSRFVSDVETARRGDVVQAYLRLSSTNRTPHTFIVQTDRLAGANNWLDSNWTATNTVGEHTVSVDTFLRYVARSPELGFTVYGL